MGLRGTETRTAWKWPIEPVVAAVRKAVGDELVIWLTSEALGLYQPDQQLPRFERYFQRGLLFPV